MENVKHTHKDVVVSKNDKGELVVTSRQVAEDFGKDHRVVVRAIENKAMSLTEQNCSVEKLFIPTTYHHNGNEYKEYLLTRDGFTFIVMGFTGPKADTWKLKYIEAFNQMEQASKYPYGHLSKEVQAIFALDIKQQQLEVEVKELKDGMPLFNVECKEIQAAVKRKGVEILGGKGSLAYKNRSIRCKVYSDIQQQLRREFGVSRYEAIKRSQLNMAHEIVAKYKAPIYLINDIYLLNQQLSDENYAV
ncbi:Rha family transcriptional regulator [Clostridium sp. D53t1_180928_C8]|uniref:Rha family transcriptional regulator n=1 Tax=Clostridium sp. D53t1_180928_C8 TaxID=2787101 RepID=UPI0018AC2428|nr:Rha family transcriptional regulator [Clostridium sp. D53t1_180928_C8]